VQTHVNREIKISGFRISDVPATDDAHSGDQDNPQKRASFGKGAIVNIVGHTNTHVDWMLRANNGEVALLEQPRAESVCGGGACQAYSSAAFSSAFSRFSAAISAARTLPESVRIE